VTDRGVSTEEWDAWRSFVTMRNALDRSLERNLQANGDISAADYEVLIALFEAPTKTLRARELSTRIAWEKSRLSHQVTRMEKRGLLERSDCDTDGRGTWVGITPDGSRAILRAMRGHNAAIREFFFDVVTAEELAALQALSQRVLGTIAGPECEPDDQPSELHDDLPQEQA